MRFLYYGHFDQISDCEGWIATTLERQGHYVLRMQRSDPALFPVMRIIDSLRMAEADVLLLSKVPEARAEELKMVKDAGFKVVFWTFDWMKDPANWRWYAPLAQVADVCFQTDGWGEPEYEEAGIKRVELHQGAFTDLHHPVVPTAAEHEKFDADVAFCGSLYTQRRVELARELRRYPGFKLWGPATEQLWGRPFAAMVACSKIIVCDNYVNHVPGYWSDRIYLTMACGGFVCASLVPGIEKVFDVGRQVSVWSTFPDMHVAINFYLEHPEERERIREEGKYIIEEQHEYKHRVRKMIKVLEGM